MKQVANPETYKVVRFEGASRTYITTTDGNRPPFTKFIDEEAYSEALSGLVVKSVDIVIFDPSTGRVLVTDRNQLPHDGAWVPGGRKRAGETDLETACVNLKRELGLDIDEGAFIPMKKNYELIWDTREQPPTVNENGQRVTGCHMSSSPVMLPIDENSLDVRHNEEFNGYSWINFEEFLEAPEEIYHPALVQMVTDAFDLYTLPDYAEIIRNQNPGVVAEAGRLALAA